MPSRLDARKKLTINGNQYDILPHGATDALKLVRRIGAFVELDRDDPMKAIPALCMKSIQDDPNLELPLELLKHVQVNGQGMNKELFDDHYSANFGELGQAVKAVVETNNFLQLGKDIGGLIG